VAAISMQHLVKTYGDGFKAVDDVSLDIADGEFMILVGPSGCGKSTLLRMIVGLEDITSGDLYIDGERVNDLAPRDRNLAMVFQNYALYPHLTVYENIAFPLRLRKGMSGDEIDRKVREAADVLELTEHLDRKPSNLSGGQRQRVAMGRAIVRDAKVFLFDEPLSNLDAKLRGQMRTEILRLQRRMGTTTVYVTHDQTEAMTLGDRVALMRRGRIQQVGTPRELYEHPVNLFVAGFIGSPPMNFVPGAMEGGTLHLPFVSFELPEDRRSVVGDRHHVTVGIRPERFEDRSLLDDARAAKGVTFEAPVDVVEWLGNEQYAYVPFETDPKLLEGLSELERELDGEQARTQLVVALDPSSRVVPGESAQFWFDPEDMHIFDAGTSENLTRDLALGDGVTTGVASSAPDPESGPSPGAASGSTPSPDPAPEPTRNG
jgi:multiple sugar transport system ATP-binding protein